MIAQVIPVRTMEPAQTEWTGSTALAHQGSMEHNVKQVNLADSITNRLMIGAKCWSSITK